LSQQPWSRAGAEDEGIPGLSDTMPVARRWPTGRHRPAGGAGRRIRMARAGPGGVCGKRGGRRGKKHGRGAGNPGRHGR